MQIQPIEAQGRRGSCQGEARCHQYSKVPNSARRSSWLFRPTRSKRGDEPRWAYPRHHGRELADEVRQCTDRTRHAQSHAPTPRRSTDDEGDESEVEAEAIPRATYPPSPSSPR